jgi:hypothetical protein
MSMLDSGSASSHTSSVASGGYCHPRLESSSREHFGFRHNAFNRNGFRNCGPFDLYLCQHKAYDVSTGCYDYYSG